MLLFEDLRDFIGDYRTRNKYRFTKVKWYVRSYNSTYELQPEDHIDDISDYIFEQYHLEYLLEFMYINSKNELVLICTLDRMNECFRIDKFGTFRKLKYLTSV